jgi:RHS repeat-associated protein
VQAELRQPTEEQPASSSPLPNVAMPPKAGANRGLGEKFTTNTANGTARLTVPLPMSAGRSGFTPPLELAYDSGAGNGPFGRGWSLSIPAISRKTDKGVPRYADGEDSDTFILAGAEDLVPVRNPDGSRHRDEDNHPGFIVERYRPRTEGLFARIERWTNAADQKVHWRTIGRDNVHSIFGPDPRSQIADPSDDDGRRIFSWLIAEARDPRGNAILYDYVAEDDGDVDFALASERNRNRSANRYLKRVRYGNRTSHLLEPSLDAAEWLFELVFDYGEGHIRVQAADSAAAGFAAHRTILASPLAGPAGAPGPRAWPARPDPFVTHRPGFPVHTYRRCERVLMFHHFPAQGTEQGYEGLAAGLAFDFEDLEPQDASVDTELAHAGSSRFASQLRSVTLSGFIKNTEAPDVVGSGEHFATYLEASWPPLLFDYSRAEIEDQLETAGFDDPALAPSDPGRTAQLWIDLHGEGLAGRLTEAANGWYYARNLSALPRPPENRPRLRFAPPALVFEAPNARLVGQATLVDLTGDGRPDLVLQGGPLEGFFKHDAGKSWEPFRDLPQGLGAFAKSPDARFIDLDGDGRSDLLIADDGALLVHMFDPELGFGREERRAQSIDEEQGPRLLLNNEDETIQLADMCGDGLTDLVRITVSSVCYWPSLGHGRFGAKVTLDNGAVFDCPDRFDPKRIRLADIDGSGTTDIVYLHPEGIDLYFNQSGNRLSSRRRLTALRPVDDFADLEILDLFGSGTAAIVRRSTAPGDARSPLQIIDILKSKRPGLLVGIDNGIGTRTRLDYASSTRFYLEDEQAGRPWLKPLPFPVMVVERATTSDLVGGNELTVRFAYHHGYFDEAEREFRGFGMVEQWDSETLASLGTATPEPPPVGGDLKTQLPPVLTKSWFHTGIGFSVGNLSERLAGLFDRNFQGEFFREEGLSDEDFRGRLLADTAISETYGAKERHDAFRALRGALLRQEIYALDGDEAKEHLPYQILQRNYGLKMLQGRTGAHQAVFLLHNRETLTETIERDPTDPRIAHELVLKVDPFGNVLQSAKLAYGRRSPNPALAPADQAIQAKANATLSTFEFTGAIDLPGDYRTPLPCGTLRHEYHGPDLAGLSAKVAPEAVEKFLEASEIDFDETPPPDQKRRRLIERSRTLYRADDLSADLPYGQSGALGLPFETYRLVLTDGLLAGALEGKADAAMLDEAGYVNLASETGWWTRSGRCFYAPSPTSAPAELAHARAHFFLPCLYRDPFDRPGQPSESLVTYDAFDLLARQSVDPLGNVVSIGERTLEPGQPPSPPGFDYRCLRPRLVMDPNGNRSVFAFDALGVMVGRAAAGKPLPGLQEGDSFDDFEPDLSPARLAVFFDDPVGQARELLGSATQRILYRPGAANPSGARIAPPCVAALHRTFHGPEPGDGSAAPIEIVLTFADGFGRDVQAKALAEPGPTLLRDAQGGILLDPDGQPRLGPASTIRWRTTGWTLFDNKGNPVRRFEPFFSDLSTFEPDVRAGAGPIHLYDPLGRPVAIVNPDQSWSKTRFGPWGEERWDGNDNAFVTDPTADPDVGHLLGLLQTEHLLPGWGPLRTDPAFLPAFQTRIPDPADRASETRGAEAIRSHSGTANGVHLDALGRGFSTFALNASPYTDLPAGSPVPKETIEGRARFDIGGLELETFDAEGRSAQRQDFDLLGRVLRRRGMDDGKRIFLPDIDGKPVFAWDDRANRTRSRYDRLRRPVEVLLKRNAAAEVAVAATLYGEDLPDAVARNIRGKAAEARDQAGRQVTLQCDFKGNVTRSSRQIAQAYSTLIDCAEPLVALGESFLTRAFFDARDRTVQKVEAHQPGQKMSVCRFTFGEGGLLKDVHVWLDVADEPDDLLDPASSTLKAVSDLLYDAKSQPVRLDRAMANGSVIRTQYDYDPLTSRLRHLYTRRGVKGLSGLAPDFAEDCENKAPPPPLISAPPQAPRGAGCGLQNLRYVYDPVGNPMEIADSAQQPIFFRNAAVDASSSFRYDALYRLIEAEGREHLGQIGGAPLPHDHGDAHRSRIPHRGDGKAMARYLERYRYDKNGNFKEIQHRGFDPAAPGWTRSFTYKEASRIEPTRFGNRLTSTKTGAEVSTFSSGGDGYDPHGSMLKMPHLSTLEWDFSDQLRMTSRQAAGPEDAEGLARSGDRTWYVYDSGGARTRKVTETVAGTIRDERWYLGGHEVYVRHGADPLRRETLSVMAGDVRIALIEQRVAGNEPGIPERLLRYIAPNHLGSGSLEVDDRGAILSYEEYSPFGSTTYQAFSERVESKRYRFGGKERDEENGFTYHGARYLAPWLGRWTSADPAGMADGPNLYAFVANNPVKMVDPSGREGRAIIEETEIKLVNKKTGKLEVVERTKQIHLPNITIEAKPPEPPPEEVPYMAPMPREKLQESVPIFSFFFRVPMQYVRPYQPVPEGAPPGLAAIRQMNGQPGVAVANFSRDYAPGTSVENLTSLTVQGISGAVGVLSSAAKLTSSTAPMMTKAVQPLATMASEGGEVATVANAADNAIPLAERGEQIFNEIGAKTIKNPTEGSVGWLKSRVTVSIVEPNGAGGMRIVNVQDPKYYKLFADGTIKLLPNEVLGPAPIVLREGEAFLAPAGKVHSEVLGVWNATALGAEGGSVWTSNPACKGSCDPLFKALPNWTHLNPQH